MNAQQRRKARREAERLGLSQSEMDRCMFERDGRTSDLVMLDDKPHNIGEAAFIGAVLGLAGLLVLGGAGVVAYEVLTIVGRN